jgi:hypothetical protein
MEQWQGLGDLWVVILAFSSGFGMEREVRQGD